MLQRLMLAPLLLAATAVAQDTCSCQPLSYTLTLDFSAVCDGTSRTSNGFKDTICYIDGGAPTIITKIVIEEQNQDTGLQPINTITIDGSFSDGDSFSFDSILAQSSDPALIPGGLLVEMTGTDADGETVSNTWVAIYSNDCSIFPVLPVGDGFGWTTLTAAGRPTAGLCPAAATLAPTGAPAGTVTQAPVVAPVAAPPTSVRVIGSDICACQPGKYSFMLNFANGCARNFGLGRTGISETECLVISGLNNTLTGDDAVPAVVNRILLSELDQDLEILRQLDIDGTFNDGVIFEYTSFTVAEANPGPTVPRGFIATLFATNAAGQSLENDVVVIYENACTDYPIIIEGDSIGWLEVANVDAPPSQYCPLVDGPVPVPTDMPIAAITLAPTVAIPEPTVAPTAGATSEPTSEPTTGATPEPTTPPVATEAPSRSPLADGETASPVDAPTEAPVVAPTDPPVVTESPSRSPLAPGMTASPVAAPVVAPTTPTPGVVTPAPSRSPLAPGMTASPLVAPVVAPTTPTPGVVTTAPSRSPLAPGMTASPVAAPVVAPTTPTPGVVTTAPSRSPLAPGMTASPVVAPVVAPTTPTPGVSPVQPTPSPPVVAPVAAPVRAATATPTSVPTGSPSDAPSDVPSDVPSDSPSNMPVADECEEEESMLSSGKGKSKSAKSSKLGKGGSGKSGKGGKAKKCKKSKKGKKSGSSGKGGSGKGDMTIEGSADPAESSDGLSSKKTSKKTSKSKKSTEDDLASSSGKRVRRAT